MQTRRIILSLAILSILAAPFGAAGPWVAWQTVEPDNALDTADFMWQDAPGDIKDRVYFAAISSWSYVVQINPNVGALGTNNEPPGAEYHEALLGVWTDCNGDDYIGMAEGALREYSSALLLDDSVCPPVDGAGTSPNRWTPGANNYRQLVTEFIPIGRDPSVRDQRLYEDDAAKVWGDFGRWNAPPSQRSCTLAPQARGTYQSTGGTLNFVDCRVDILGMWNIASDAAGNPGGLTFADPDDAEGSFADFETAGSEDTQHSPATVWDCGDPYLVRSGDVLNESGLGPLTADETGGGPNHDYAVWGVDPQVSEADPTTWTIPAFYNHTNEGLEGYDQDPDGDGCDTSNDRGADFYSGVCVVYCIGEGDFNGVDPNNKKEADWNFGFATANRGGAPVSLLGAIGGSGNAGYNEGDLGVGEGGSRWLADTFWLSKPGPALVKSDVEGGTVGLPDAYWLTFYAYVSPTISDRFELPGGVGIYGSWHCGDAQDGISQGFNCDPDAWYVNPDGTLINDDDNELARVHQPYNLRDSDCYDGNVGAASGVVGSDVGILPASYGENPCP